jgi:hypothetical protein
MLWSASTDGERIGVAVGRRVELQHLAFLRRQAGKQVLDAGVGGPLLARDVDCHRAVSAVLAEEGRQRSAGRRFAGQAVGGGLPEGARHRDEIPVTAIAVHPGPEVDLARPLLNAHWPQLSGVIQPLAGEYAARRAVLRRLPFVCGYGVELAMLIDLVELEGLSGLAR